MIKAVVFDLDGTLLDRESSLERFIKSQYNRFKNALQHIPKEAFLARFIELDEKGCVWKDRVYEQLAEEYQLQGISSIELLDDYIKNFSVQCTPFPHLLEMLDALKENSLRLGMITNGKGQFQMDNIQALEIASYFDVILISEWEGVRKPDPEIFYKALRKLGVRAEEAVYIGDHPKNDIEAAMAVGMTGIWKKDEYWGKAETDFYIEDLLEIPKLMNKLNLNIRPYRTNDLDGLVALFYETVHAVNAADYNQQQLNAWAPQNSSKERKEKWRHSLSRNETVVAELNGKLVGFCDIQQDGYLNRLFVHKDHQRQGIAAALLKRIEEEAANKEMDQITTDASLTAKPFFEKHGYQLIKCQTIERNGVELINHKMVKNLK